jgi:hypothetical protein
MSSPISEYSNFIRGKLREYFFNSVSLNVMSRHVIAPANIRTSCAYGSQKSITVHEYFAPIQRYFVQVKFTLRALGDSLF